MGISHPFPAQDAYNEHLRRVDLEALAFDGDAQTFHALLREKLCRAFAERQEAARAPTAAAALAALLPTNVFVDSYLESLKMDKLEQIMRQVVLDDALHAGLLRQPLRAADFSRDAAAGSGGAAAPSDAPRKRPHGARKRRH